MPAELLLLPLLLRAAAKPPPRTSGRTNPRVGPPCATLNLVAGGGSTPKRPPMASSSSRVNAHKARGIRNVASYGAQDPYLVAAANLMHDGRWQMADGSAVAQCVMIVCDV